MATEALLTPMAVGLESQESPIYRTFVRNRPVLPTGGIGTGAPPSVEQTAPSRLWVMPPAGGLEASQRTEREGDAPFGANYTSHEVSRRLLLRRGVPFPELCTLRQGTGTGEELFPLWYTRRGCPRSTPSGVRKRRGRPSGNFPHNASPSE